MFSTKSSPIKPVSLYSITLLCIVLTNHCVSASVRTGKDDDYWNRPCGGISLETTPPPLNSHEFLSLISKTSEILYQVERFQRDYVGKKANTRVSRRTQNLLDRTVTSLPGYVDAEAFTLASSDVSNTLSSIYRQTSFMSVFFDQIERYENRYDNGRFSPDVRQFQRIMSALRCHLASVLVAARAPIPQVSAHVIGLYDAFSRHDCHEFAYLVLRDTIRVLRRHKNSYRRMYDSSMRRDGHSTTAEPTITSTNA